MDGVILATADRENPRTAVSPHVSTFFRSPVIAGFIVPTQREENNDKGNVGGQVVSGCKQTPPQWLLTTRVSVRTCVFASANLHPCVCYFT